MQLGKIAYKIILKQLIRQEEKLYYEHLFNINAHDLRKIWKFINDLINKNAAENKTKIFKINGIVTRR